MPPSTLDPSQQQEPMPEAPGHDIDALGPSDSSDSGSDTQGAVRRPAEIEDELDQHALESGIAERESDTDQGGTGERASADGDANFRPDSDVLPDSTQSFGGLDAIPTEAFRDAPGIADFPNDDDDLADETVEPEATDEPSVAPSKEVERTLRGLGSKKSS